MRRTRDLTTAEATGWTLTGFGAGLLAGALLAGWVGAGGTLRARQAWQGWRSRGPARPNTAATAARAQAALWQSDLKQHQLRVIGVGPGTVELHGWVPSRLLRAQEMEASNPQAEGGSGGRSGGAGGTTK